MPATELLNSVRDAIEHVVDPELPVVTIGMLGMVHLHDLMRAGAV
jgi:metal-sulfur cluster biosynthetic enzyme